LALHGFEWFSEGYIRVVRSVRRVLFEAVERVGCAEQRRVVGSVYAGCGLRGEVFGSHRDLHVDIEVFGV
jgi:hypothetical protein